MTTNANNPTQPPTREELAYMLERILQYVPQRSIKHPAGFSYNLARALLARMAEVTP